MSAYITNFVNTFHVFILFIPRCHCVMSISHVVLSCHHVMHTNTNLIRIHLDNIYVTTKHKVQLVNSFTGISNMN